MSDTTAPREDRTVTIVGAFPDAAAASHAVESLRIAGIAERAITTAGAGRVEDSTAPQQEAGFIWRLVLVVVLWSIVGVGVGAIVGIVFAAAGIPPGGAFGVILQIIAWGLFFHILVGLWAGYALLTRGESRRPVQRTRDGRTLVSVRCPEHAAASIDSSLRSWGATSVGSYSADGRPIG